MAHGVLAGSQLHESAQVGDDALDLTVVESAHLGFKDDVLYGLASGTAGLDVAAGNKDAAVVVDVYLAAGVGGDLLDDLAAGADDLPDLVGIDLHLYHLGGGLGQLLAGLGNGLEHDGVQYLEAGLLGDGEGFLDYLVLEAVVLQIHLDGGDALLGTGHFEVHFTVEVFDALDIYESGEVLAVLDKAAGDAGHRGLDRHTGVHKGQGSAADGTLGSGAVGGEHLGDYADGVGEVLHIRDNGLQSLFHQSAVTVFPAAGGAAGTGLAGGVGGHIVVVHEALFFLFPNGVQLLALAESGQGGYGQDLGLAPGKETGAVYQRNDAHFGGQGTDLVHLTAVNTLAGQQPLLYDLLLELVEDLVHVLHHVGMLLAVLLLNHGDPVVDSGLTDVLVVGVHAVLHGLELVFNQLVKELVVEGSVLILELGLAHFLHHLVDEVQHRLEVLMGLDYALIHHVVGDLVGLGLDHDYLLVGGGNGGGHTVALTLSLSGVEEILLPVPAQDYAGDGTVEGHVRDGDGSGGADHGGYLRGAVSVHAEHFAGDDYVVAQVGGEEGAHWPVNEAGCQHCGQAGLALTAHEAAGDAAHGVELFVKVYGEGEVVDSILGAGGGGAGDQHGGLTVLHQHGGVAELGQLAHFHGQRTTLVHHFVLFVVGELLVGDYHLDSPLKFRTSPILST